MFRFAPYLAFFASGASSLIFQMIWSRLLHHVFGSSSVAISSVVSVFMAGLALGAWLFGRFADRIRRPLLLYAWAELGVALFALCVPWLIDPEGWLAGANAALRARYGSESLGFALARFACIVPVLIVPTTLMGSTLPLLSRHFVESSAGSGEVSKRVGRLYAVNTVGAVLGVFLGGFVLLPELGVRATNLVAVGMNLALACTIFALRGLLGERSAAQIARSAETAVSADRNDVIASEGNAYSPGLRRVAALAFACSGACALLYEVVWSRALINTIGGSVYSFALILMTFLVGIAGGSALGSALVDATRSALRPLAIVATLACCALGLPLGLRFGAWAWLAVSAGLVGVVLALWRAGGPRRGGFGEEEGEESGHRQGQGHVEDKRALVVLAVPVLAAAVIALAMGGRLPALLGCSLASVIAIPAVLVWLRGRLIVQLAALQLLIAGATFVSALWADEVSLTFAAMVAPLYRVLGEHVDRVMAMMFATAALCVLPGALGMGAMFPFTMRVWSAGGARVGREVGVVYTGNTIGSIVGAWLPGFVLMPSLGMQLTLHIGIALNALLGLAVLVAAAGTRAWRAALVAVPAWVALCVWLVWAATPASPLGWNLTKMTLGVFRISLAKDVLDEETWGEPDLLYYRDGLSTTVSIERWGRHYSLKNNGKVEASNGDDMPTQIMVAALPMLLHPSGGKGIDAAIIGVGSGVTVGAALQFPLRSLEVMELERSVIEASRYFADVNHLQYTSERYPYVSNPGLTVINDDGRNYLASTERRYDVIVGEPSNPWLTGVADLFTADHFRIAKRKLRPDGIYCEWIQLYEMSPENVKTLYRTFASQFRHALVFSAEDLSSDTVLVGSDSPLPLDYERLRRAMAAPGVARELERAYVHSPYDVLARVLLGGKDEVMRYTMLEQRLRDGRWQSVADSTNEAPCPPAECRRTPAPINTDDNALIEMAAPRDLIGFERYKGYLQTIYAPSWPYGRLAARLQGFGSGATASERYGELALALLAHGRKREADELARRATAAGASASQALAVAMAAALGPNPREPALNIAPPEPDPTISERANARMQQGYVEVNDWLARGDAKHAKQALESIPSSLLRQFGSELRLLRAYVLYKAGEHDMAIGEYEAVARRDPDVVVEHPELYFFLARSHDALLHFDKAVRSMRAYLDATRRPASKLLDATPEPASDQAPTSDAPGTTPKGWHEPAQG